MFELLILIAAIAIGGALLVGFLKLIVSLALLPFKVGFWLIKGVLALVILLPLTIIFFNLFAFAVPVVLFALFLPIIIGVIGLLVLFKLIF